MTGIILVTLAAAVGGCVFLCWRCFVLLQDIERQLAEREIIRQSQDREAQAILAQHEG